jgi:hypothetical protein
MQAAIAGLQDEFTEGPLEGTKADDRASAISGGSGGVARQVRRSLRDLQHLSHHLAKSAFSSMSLNNNHPVNNEGQGSGSGSGDWTKDKGRYK